jgi:hypothetical protein
MFWNLHCIGNGMVFFTHWISDSILMVYWNFGRDGRSVSKSIDIF